MEPAPDFFPEGRDPADNDQGNDQNHADSQDDEGPAGRPVAQKEEVNKPLYPQNENADGTDHQCHGGQRAPFPATHGQPPKKEKSAQQENNGERQVPIPVPSV